MEGVMRQLSGLEISSSKRLLADSGQGVVEPHRVWQRTRQDNSSSQGHQQLRLLTRFCIGNLC